MGQNAGTADVIYRFVYDALGRLVNVKLNDIPLLTNTYSADRLSQLISAIQGDGYRVHYKLLAVTGSMASTLGRQNPIRYRGYEYDEESGLYYLRSM